MSLNDIDSEPLTIECIRCSGSGWAEIPAPKCSNCLGLGKDKCPECSGTGEANCVNCSAKGTITCENCFGMAQLICPNCDGSGLLGEIISVTCSGCDGSGVSSGQFTCTTCFGTGQMDQEPDPCVRCDATGQIKCKACDAGKADCPECNLGKTTCYTCKGKGSAKCSQCGGHGSISTKPRFKCDLCYGEGSKTIVMETSGRPDTAYLQKFYIMLSEQMKKGQQLNDQRLEALSERVRHSSVVTSKQLESVKSKYNPEQLQTQVNKLLKENNSASYSTEDPFRCVGCNRVPHPKIKEKWQRAADYGKPVNCICGQTINLRRN